MRSPFTFSGYLGQPEASAEALNGAWYRTGDLGYRVGDLFYVAGRRKDVMIVSGVNVFPNDVEELVTRVQGVAGGRVSVFSTFDPAVQTERVMSSTSPTAGVARHQTEVTIEIRQRMLATFQLANFEVHHVPAGWLVKSSSGQDGEEREPGEMAVRAPAGRVSRPRALDPRRLHRRGSRGGARSLSTLPLDARCP